MIVFPACSLSSLKFSQSSISAHFLATSSARGGTCILAAVQNQHMTFEQCYSRSILSRKQKYRISRSSMRGKPRFGASPWSMRCADGSPYRQTRRRSRRPGRSRICGRLLFRMEASACFPLSISGFTCLCSRPSALPISCNWLHRGRANSSGSATSTCRFAEKAACVLHDHKLILNAIMSGDVQAADEAVPTHLSGTLETVDQIAPRNPDNF